MANAPLHTFESTLCHTGKPSNVQKCLQMTMTNTSMQTTKHQSLFHLSGMNYQTILCLIIFAYNPHTIWMESVFVIFRNDQVKVCNAPDIKVPRFGSLLFVYSDFLLFGKLFVFWKDQLSDFATLSSSPFLYPPFWFAF